MLEIIFLVVTCRTIRNETQIHRLGPLYHILVLNMSDYMQDYCITSIYY